MILLTLSYRGTNFRGFGVQPGLRTVQGTVQDAIEQIYGVRYPVVGCSRTDSGVHARDYKLTFIPAEDAPRIAACRIPSALNAVLPEDIAVLGATTVPDDFHVRHDVYEKEYEYVIYNAPIRSPFYENTAYHYKHPLDEKLLSDTAALFCGTHDFRAFMASGSDVADTTRTVRSTSVTRSGDIIYIRISADGFLYNMVRIFVGTLLAVAEGRIAQNDIANIISLCDRQRAGATVPAHGLYLNRVTFQKPIGEEERINEKGHVCKP